MFVFVRVQSCQVYKLDVNLVKFHKAVKSKKDEGNYIINQAATPVNADNLAREKLKPNYTELCIFPATRMLSQPLHVYKG